MKAPNSPTDALIRIAAYGDSLQDRDLAWAALTAPQRLCVVDLRFAICDAQSHLQVAASELDR